MSDVLVYPYRYFTPPPPIVPSDLTGLARWWKADDAATVIASAGSVSQWTDKAGGNDNLTQATSGARPRTGLRTINGRNALDFDGGDHLATATSLAQPLTNFIVVQSDLATTAITRYLMGGAGNSFQLSVDTGGNLVAYAAGFIQINGWLNTNVRLLTNVANGAGSFMRADGGGNVTGTGGDFGSNGTQLGGHGSIGNWDGAIAEVIQYDRVLTGTEIGQVEAYLAAQWGLTLP